MTIDFYQLPASPPCRTIFFTAQHLGIKLNEKYVDLFAGEHLKPEFLKMNPQHTVPVINDDGFCLTESRAIVTYLVNKYAPNHPIYPEDPKKRAVIDRMLYLDAGLFAAIRDITMPLWLKGTPPSQEKLEAIKKHLNIFEESLGKTSYAAADHITLADFSFTANIEHLKIIDIDLSGYPRITAWMQKLKKEIPNFHEINEVPVQKVIEYFKNRESTPHVSEYQFPSTSTLRFAVKETGTALTANIMTIDLYQLPESPPCRTVIFTAQHLGIKLNEKYMDLFTGEHLKPEFLEINPQCTVPVINDDGFYLWESRAIAAYLVNKYAPNHPIYPEDPHERAVIDRMLYLDCGLFAAERNIMVPLWKKGTPPSQEHLEALKKQLNIFEESLGKTSYAAADHITLADFSLVTHIEQVRVINFDLSGYPRITVWMQKLKKEIPNFHEINEVPVQKCKEYFENKKHIP
ncbi:uncharacterized protein LOC129220941 [Uloborus diversus]|uniref:uncharacterized protein LOC129220941 n=1 Tax=Uloborus diversus TaxID=327109 RepID=UPI00240988B6|nr:uncharacterized protein LOC129220941 [Uloborus diversus]